jgi:uncharacterized protein (DUF736 family)
MGAGAQRRIPPCGPWNARRGLCQRKTHEHRHHSRQRPRRADRQHRHADRRHELRPARRGSNHPNAPRYEICTRSPAGAAVQIGALWEQTSKTTGECFLQGRIDDPSMARPLAISAFRQSDGSYNVAGCAPSAAPAFAWRPRPTTIPLIWTRPDGLLAMPRVMIARGIFPACGAWRHAGRWPCSAPAARRWAATGRGRAEGNEDGCLGPRGQRREPTFGTQDARGCRARGEYGHEYR